MADMTPEEETATDAKARLKELDHKVAEAQESVDKAPDDTDARNKLAMMIAIRDVAKDDLAKAESRLERQGG